MVDTSSYSSDEEMIGDGGIEPITISPTDMLSIQDLALDSIVTCFEEHRQNEAVLLKSLASVFAELADVQTARVLRVYTGRLGTSAMSAAIQTRMLGDKRPGREIAREFGLNPGVFFRAQKRLESLLDGVKRPPATLAMNEHFERLSAEGEPKSDARADSCGNGSDARCEQSVRSGGTTIL